MENKDLINIIAFTLSVALIVGLFTKKAKVQAEKKEIEQEMLDRKNQLQEQQPECSLDILCQSDPQYIFMQDLVNQVDTYLGFINIGIIMNLVPLIYIMHGIVTENYGTLNKTGTVVEESTGELKNKSGTHNVKSRNVRSTLMPRNIDFSGIAEANAQVYLYHYFEQTDPLNTYLKKKLNK